MGETLPFGEATGPQKLLLAAFLMQKDPNVIWSTIFAWTYWAKNLYRLAGEASNPNFHWVRSLCLLFQFPFHLLKVNHHASFKKKNPELLPTYSTNRWHLF